MKHYRIVEIYPKHGKRGDKRVREKLWSGVDREAWKREINAYYAKPERRPYAELLYYHGSKRVYAYEL